MEVEDWIIDREIEWWTVEGHRLAGQNKKTQASHTEAAQTSRQKVRLDMAANSNILSPSHRLLRLPTSASNLLPNINFPATNKHLYFLNSSTVVAPTFTARATTTSDPDVHDATPKFIASTGWVKFAENVSGEWDGFGADFTAEGTPIELPESVVPEAYREWEVKVFDWQTQCPTLAQSQNNSPSLMYRTIKLLPTVGCEADAATVHTIQERNIYDSSTFAYQPTGCYVAVWPVNTKAMELEHCLIDPNNKESRVRVIQALEWKESEMLLVSIRVFVEQWYGPFRNGDQLGGCAIRDSAFAATEPLKAVQVSGVWQGVGAVANFNTIHNMIQQVDEERGSRRSRDEDGLILLPKRLWCSVKRVEEETWCEVGWLLDEGRAITSKCSFSSAADLKEIGITSETASPV